MYKFWLQQSRTSESRLNDLLITGQMHLNNELNTMNIIYTWPMCLRKNIKNSLKI